MTEKKEYSNEEFGFGSSAYAEPAAKKEETKIADSPSVAPKIQRAAVTATASTPQAPVPVAPPAVAPALPPVPSAVASTPNVASPVESGDFWKSAALTTGVPIGLGLFGAGLGYALGKNKTATPSGGVEPPNPEIEAAKVREAQARALKAEHDAAIKQHHLQQLQAGAKTAPASAKSSVSEADLKLLQQSGFNETSKELQAKEAASKLAPSTDAINKNTPAAEVQGAVNVVKQQEQKQFENMKPTYNKTKKNIGPGAYNWLAGQEGPKAPEVWQNIVGDKNVPYSEFMEKNKPVYEAYLGSYGEPDPFKQVAKPGEYRAPSMIPKSIKGSVAPNALAATAALATVPALAAAGYQSYKGNKEAVDAELKDAWHSLKSAFTWPVDVAKAAGKGDFGPLKDALMSMNPGTLLLNEANKQDQQAIQRMIQAEKVGAGRGIAPPSSYQR